jgi:hypothetical protein
MTYEELERTVLKARTGKDAPAASLFEIVAQGAGGGDEAEFVDAVARNLKRGRAIVAVVGDGIREDILPLAELLQSHAGHRFTFALVELAVYTTPEADVRLVVPSVLAQTTLIERGVVRIDSASGAITVDRPAAPALASGPGEGKGISIGVDEFFDVLGQREPALPDLLKAFLGKAEELGIFVDRQSGLNLKHEAPDGPPLNLGTIRKDGFVDTGPATWWGRKPYGQRYNETLAEAIGGRVGPMKDGAESALRTAAGKTPRLSDLLPRHEQTWLDAMQRYIKDSWGEREG